MRIIKFRAKKKFNGTIGSDCWIYSSNIRFSKAGDTKILYLDGQQCIIETLGQFTGLTDKNGKEIYENDNLQCEGSPIYTVTWQKDRWKMCGTKNGNGFCVDIQDFMEIIGNIHEATK